MTEAVLFERQGAVATLTLNRPEVLNALNADLAYGLDTAVARCVSEPGLRAVILTGAGKSFMAGGDIRAFHAFTTDPTADIEAEVSRLMIPVQRAILTLRTEVTVPVIAKVRGAAAGFGLSLVLACDLAVAAHDSTFTTAYASIATSPDGSMSWMLPRLVGLKRAAEMLLLPERLDATTALGLGLINRVVPEGDLDSTVNTLAERLASGPTHAFAHLKRLLNQAHATPLAVQLDSEAAAFTDCAQTKDFAEGVAAFLEKRKAEFGGG